MFLKKSQDVTSRLKGFVFCFDARHVPWLTTNSNRYGISLNCPHQRERCSSNNISSTRAGPQIALIVQSLIEKYLISKLKRTYSWTSVERHPLTVASHKDAHSLKVSVFHGVKSLREGNFHGPLWASVFGSWGLILCIFEREKFSSGTWWKRT